MTQTKHTPGPWKLWHSGYAESPYIIYVGGKPFINSKGKLEFSSAPSTLVGEIDCNAVIKRDGDYEYTGEANAKLIAAAPELLDAAKYAVECLEKLTINTGDLGDQAYQSLKDAITKATF